MVILINYSIDDDKILGVKWGKTYARAIMIGQQICNIKYEEIITDSVINDENNDVYINVSGSIIDKGKHAWTISLYNTVYIDIEKLYLAFIKVDRLFICYNNCTKQIDIEKIKSNTEAFIYNKFVIEIIEYKNKQYSAIAATARIEVKNRKCKVIKINNDNAKEIIDNTCNSSIEVIHVFEELRINSFVVWYIT